MNRGKTLIVDASAVIGDLIVQAGGKLIFAGDQKLELSARSIEVSGTLRIGTEACPLRKKIVVTLRGSSDASVFKVNNPYQEATGALGKGISVRAGGTFDAHGAPHHKTWTRLAETAGKGSSQLVLQDDVDWVIGQKVVIVTTVYHDFNDEHHQNEVRTIKAVSGNRITLNRALSFSHYGGPEYSGEVALLTRSVKIQGDEKSSVFQYGGHTICERGSICRLSYVEGFRLGQRNVMARYPFHFHMMGSVDARLVYLKGCSVHKSYFRAYTIHATSGTELLDNVAFDIIGSAYYLEDGVEENNLLQGNLAAFVHVIRARSYREYGTGQTADIVRTVPERIVPSDITAAGFYCTNANNRWKNNAASGGFVGFLFPALNHALGKSYKSHKSMRPESVPLLEFDGNTAHSSGKYWRNGACIYVGGRFKMRNPESNVRDYVYDYGRTNTADRGGNMRKGGQVFTNTKVFLCNFGVAFWGGQNPSPYLALKGFEASDTPGAAVMMLGQTAIADAILTGYTRNTGVVNRLPQNQQLPSSGKGVNALGIFIYDTAAQMVMTNITFKNYNRESSRGRDACYMDLTHSNVFVPQSLAVAKAVKFQNVPPKFRFYHHKQQGCPGSQQGTCPRNCQGCEGSSLASLYANILDEDGTLSGFPGGGIIGAADSGVDTRGRSNEWWRLDDICTTNRFGGFYGCPRTTPASSQKREIVTINVYKGTGLRWERNGPLAIPGTMYHFGRVQRKLQVGLGGNYQVTGACCDIGWYFKPNSLPKVFSFALTQMVKSGGIILAITFPSNAQPTVKKCKGAICRTLPKAISKAAFLSDKTTWPRVFANGNTLFVRLVNEQNVYNTFENGARVLDHRYTGRHVYTIQHRGSTGSVSMKLPATEWLRRV